MKNYLSTVLLIFLLSATTNLSAQTRDVGNFSGVRASTSVSVKLVKSNETKVEYKILKGSDDDLITEIKGNNLIVKMKSKWGGWNNSKAKVIVYYTDINDVSVSAGASLKAEEPIYADDMDVDVSSGASVDIEVISETLDAESSSGASLRIEGKSNKAEYDASSGATINAKLMQCNYVNADVSSGATIKCHVDKKLNADASSGGSIRYTGDADDNRIDKGWSGSIARM